MSTEVELTKPAAPQSEIEPRTVELKHSFYIDVVKRALDIIIVLCASVVAVPVLLIVALITLFDVGSPVLFKQVRIGRGGKPFVIYKFRNMTNERDENGNLLPPEQRVTKLGKIIRATSMDELPQLYNILKGDMSIIGPRPLLPEYLPRYTEEHMRRHSVRPGLECPMYEKLDHFWSWDEQFGNDVWYVDHCSLKVDIHQCFRIVQMVLDRKDNKVRGDATRTVYREEEFGGIQIVDNSDLIRKYKEQAGKSLKA